MTSLESLVVEIRAQGEQFTAALTQMEGRLNKFEKTSAASALKVESSMKALTLSANSVTGAFAKLTAGLGFLASGAVVGKLGEMTKAALELGDSIDEQATKLGLTSKALQEYEGAARISGVQSEEFSAAIVHLNQSLAEALDDPKGAKADTFRKLGIDIGGAGKAAIGTEAALRQMLVSVNRVGSATENTKNFREIFGRGGAGLITLGASGAGGIEEAIGKMHELGAVMHSETIAAASKLNDQWDIMSKAIKVQLSSALVELGPIFLQLIDYTRQFAAGINTIVHDIVGARLQSGIANLTKLIEVGRAAGKNVDDLIKQRKELVSQFEDLANPGGVVNKPPELNPGGPTKAQQEAIKKTQEEIEALTAKNRALAEAISLNLSVAQAEARATAAEAAHKTGSEALGNTLGRLTAAYKERNEFLAAQDAANKAQSEAALLGPRQLALFQQGLANNTPFDELKRKLDLLAVDVNWQVLADRLKNSIPQEYLNRLHEALINTQLLKNASEEEQKHYEAITNVKRSLSDEMEAELARNEVLKAGIAAGHSYWKIQQDVANALELVKLRQQAVKDNLTEDEIAQIEAREKEVQAVKTQNEAYTRQAELADQISSQITSAFFDMTKDIHNAFDILRNLITGILNDIANEILKHQITKPLAKVINSWLDQVLSGSAGGSGGSPFTSGLDSLLSGGGLSGFMSWFGAGSMPGIVSGGFIDAGAQAALGSGAIDASSVLWSAAAFHSGGLVGSGGMPRMVTPSLFVGAPRFHGGLAADEYPAILQKGERVIPRGGMRGSGGITVVQNISTSDAGSFMRSSDQIATNARQHMEIANRRFG